MKRHTYEVIRNSNHNYLVDLYDITPSVHSVYGLFEVDITDALNIIREFSDKNTYHGMLQGWIVKCFAKAVEDFGTIMDTAKIGFAGHSYGAGATPEMARRAIAEGWDGLVPVIRMLVSELGKKSRQTRAAATVWIEMCK